MSLSAGKLVVIPISGDQVVLHTFQLDAALEAMKKDYLLVTVVPPSYLKAGSQLKHDLRVRSNRGGVSYKLLTAPSGMTIDPAGVVHWQVPAEAPEEPISVSIQIDDASGLKTVHAFSLTVVQQE